jgi:uncharacterized protein (DUF849 family)
MADECFITCAVTGAGPSQGIHPNLPITPAQISEAAISAARAGAAIAHIHVRDPETGQGLGRKAFRPDLFRETVDLIRASSTDVVINLSTGLGGDFVPSGEDPNVGAPESFFLTPSLRMQHVVECRPELCSLDVATMSFGDVPFINTPAHLIEMARIARESGVKPELEVFEMGHLRLARKLIDEGHIGAPALFQFCLGIDWGAPATVETVMLLRSLLPPGAIWSCFGIKALQRRMVGMSALLGGNIRTGLEDNLYLSKGVFASNAELVEQAVRIVQSLGMNLLGPAEVRRKLDLRRHHPN